MNFIESLSTSEGKNTILVGVCRLTKYEHFIPLTHPFTASTVTKFFMDHVFKLRGASESIMFDRHKVFTSLFWKDLFKCMDTTPSFSTTYHFQIDEQTEMINQCLEAYLRCTCHSQLAAWPKWISLAAWWYNATFHSSIKMSSFEALYGYSPIFLPLPPNVLPTVGSMEDML